jgi:hypothetical protein
MVSELGNFMRETIAGTTLTGRLEWCANRSVSTPGSNCDMARRVERCFRVHGDRQCGGFHKEFQRYSSRLNNTSYRPVLQYLITGALTFSARLYRRRVGTRSPRHECRCLSTLAIIAKIRRRLLGLALLFGCRCRSRTDRCRPRVGVKFVLSKN